MGETVDPPRSRLSLFPLTLTQPPHLPPPHLPLLLTAAGPQEDGSCALFSLFDLVPANRFYLSSNLEEGRKGGGGEEEERRRKGRGEEEERRRRGGGEEEERRRRGGGEEEEREEERRRRGGGEEEEMVADVDSFLSRPSRVRLQFRLILQ